MSAQRMIYLCFRWITGSGIKATQGKNENAKKIQNTFKCLDRCVCVPAWMRACMYTHSLLGVSAALSKFTLSYLILERNQLEGRLIH